MTDTKAKHHTSPSARRILFPATLFAICLALLLLVYAVTLIPRGLAVYNNIKTKQPQPMRNEAVIEGVLGEFDPVLGYRLVPNSTGAWLLPYDGVFPFHNDNEGIRAPLGVSHAFKGDSHPRLLFLGDSFTYGQLVAFEDTFASKVAMALNGESINASVPGYSLAQMLLYARQIVPERKPDYLIVQYSPWLVLRALSGRVTDKMGLALAPYFYGTKEHMQVAPTPFVPPQYLVEREAKYKSTPKGFWDAVGFFTTVGIPFYAHHMYHLAIFRSKQLLGLAPTKSTDTVAIIKYAYQAFDELAKKNHAKLVILALGTVAPLHVPVELFPTDALVVNGWKSMVDNLDPPTTNNYVRQYFHWRGTPPVPVDWHPNEKADAIVADAIVNAIRAAPTGKMPTRSVILREHREVAGSMDAATTRSMTTQTFQTSLDRTTDKEVGSSNPNELPPECALKPSTKTIVSVLVDVDAYIKAVTLSVFRERRLSAKLCDHASP